MNDQGGIAAGILLVLLGLWLLAQTLIGGLPGRVTSWATG